MPETLAAVTDLADWLGEAITDEADIKRAQLCLRLASSLVRSEAGRAWDGDADVVPEEAFTVTLYCASRVYENRNAQTTGSLDDYSEGFKVEESGAYLTPSEKRSLARFRVSAWGGLGVVATTRERRPVSDEGWVPTGTEGVVFPWY